MCVGVYRMHVCMHVCNLKKNNINIYIVVCTFCMIVCTYVIDVCIYLSIGMYGMYECIVVCMYACVHTCMHVCMYGCIYVMYVCMYVM